MSTTSNIRSLGSFLGPDPFPDTASRKLPRVPLYELFILLDAFQRRTIFTKDPTLRFPYVDDKSKT